MTLIIIERVWFEGLAASSLVHSTRKKDVDAENNKAEQIENTSTSSGGELAMPNRAQMQTAIGGAKPMK